MNTDSGRRFDYCLNPSTLLPFGLDLEAQLKVAGDAGYSAIEPWFRDIVSYQEEGGRLPDLKRRFDDAGVAVAGVITFFTWADRDAATRREALADARRQMEVVRQIGGTAVAAPPFGDVEGVTLDQMAEWYADLWDVAREVGVRPVLEFWGHADGLSTLSDAIYVATASGVREATILLDVFHLHKGGSGHETVGMINASAVGMVHMNDYPDSPARQDLTDADRVFPGDGAAPLDRFLKDLEATGYRGMLSLELFIPDYGRMDASEVATVGLAKMTDAVDRALG